VTWAEPAWLVAEAVGTTLSEGYLIEFVFYLINYHMRFNSRFPCSTARRAKHRGCDVKVSLISEKEP